MTAIFHVEGLPEIQRALERVAPRESRRILRRALGKMASDMRREIKASAPVDTGTLRRAIRSKLDRGSRESVEASVRITTGRKARDDAWYWRFVEYGTKKRPARHLIRQAIERARSNLAEAFRAKFGVAFEREMEKQGKA